MSLNFKPRHLFVFDIETIPDDLAALNLVSSDIESQEDRRKALSDYHLAITEGKNDFLRQPFHKVVVISFLVAEIDYDTEDNEVYTLLELRSGGNEKSSEELLVKGFFNKIEELKPRIVSFNGRTFDIPVLKYRAMKYGITADFFHKSGNKYDSYSNRYSLNWHCDLIDGLSDFGASARIKLNEVCSILGLPGKFGVDGSKVTEMIDNNKIKEVRDYCETDVLNTYLVYLKYSLHMGRISKDNHNKAIDNVLRFIESSKHRHLEEFKEQWSLACGNKFLL